ncbi:MAG TPA: DNA adenine methylase [Polyangiaceae bacterium]
MEVRPIVKWAGGKSRLLPELRKHLPAEIRTYAEPFAGGAALFFALAQDDLSGLRDSKRFKQAILADRNEDLIACYRAVRDTVEDLIGALGEYRYDKDLFYEVRDRDSSVMNDVERGARFIFLNRTCFNGLWRVNSRGKFNVPFGSYKNPKIADPEGLRAASKAFQKVTLSHADFSEVTAELRAGDFVYFDPPYVPASDTADFTAYAVEGFGATEQARLVDELERLRTLGVFAMLSNADTPRTRALYKDFHFESVEAPRSINADGAKRGNATELIVTNWGPKPVAKKTRGGRARP